MKKSNCATIMVGEYKYSIDSDTMADIELKSGAIIKGVRIVGTTMLNDSLRVVGDEGINQIPVNLIKNITEPGKPQFPGITKTKK